MTDKSIGEIQAGIPGMATLMCVSWEVPARLVLYGKISRVMHRSPGAEGGWNFKLRSDKLDHYNVVRSSPVLVLTAKVDDL